MKIYDSESKKYALFQNEGEAFLANFERKHILTRIVNKNDSFASVLEVGCGWGRYLSFVSQYTDNAVGADLSKQMLLRFKKRFPNLNIAMVQADMKHLPFKDEVFNLVYSIRAFKYSPHPFSVMVEIHRLSKVNGQAAIYEVNNGFSFAYLTFLIKKSITHRSDWSPISSLVSMKHYFKSAGFDKISCEGILTLPPSLYSIVKAKKLLKFFATIEMVESKIPYFGKFAYGVMYSARKAK